MRLILVNISDLTVITPSPAATNAYFTFVIPADSVATITIVPTIDPNMSVDGMNAVVQLNIAIAGKVGSSAYADEITVIGETIFTTENNQKLILQGQVGTGKAGSTVTIKSCGQSSTFAE